MTYKKKNNLPKPKDAQNVAKSMDRAYHDSENFLYKYRWGIVLILAMLLFLYLYTKNHNLSKELGLPDIGASITGATNAITQAARLEKNTLDIASPPPVAGVDASTKSFFGF
jgi:hypothetical protein